MPKKLQFTGSLQGPPGKTAYEYAQDGGYTGSESDFYTKLAQDNPTREEFNQLASAKADKTTVGTSLNTKADKTTVDSLSSTKADKTTVETIQSSLTENTRKTEALWQFHQGVTHWFEEDSASVYQRDVPSGAKMASLKQIGGKTIVWNQLLGKYNEYQSYADTSKTHNSIAWTVNPDKSITANGTASNKSTFIIYPDTTDGFIPKSNHTYLMKGCPKNGSVYTYYFRVIGNAGSIGGNDYGQGRIIQQNSDVGFCGIVVRIEKGTTVENITFRPQLIDLTLMFGAGNEPATVEEFESMFPEDYYEYNEGTLLSMPCNEVVEKGKNLIDFSKCLADSFVSSSDGLVRSVTNYNVSSTDHISVIPGKTYFFSGMTTLNIGNTGAMYDINGKYAGAIDSDSGLRPFIAPYGVYSIRLSLWGNNYPNSDSSIAQFEKNDSPSSYSPYHCTSHPIPQAILDLDGYGDSVSDDIFNYIDYDRKQYVKRVGKVDLGTLDWIYESIAGGAICFKYTSILNDAKTYFSNDVTINLLNNKYLGKNADQLWSSEEGVTIFYSYLYIHDEKYNNDAAAFKSAMSGVMLYYELAEPVVTDISDLLISAVPFDVEPGGTLTFKNSNGDGYRVPIHNSVEYAVKLEEVL